jgi:transcriptional regulator with XRE-family HTH domain
MLMNRVKEFREQTGVSQSRFARLCDMNTSALCRIEGGARCSRQTARIIADTLKVAPEVLFPNYADLRERR